MVLLFYWWKWWNSNVACCRWLADGKEDTAIPPCMDDSVMVDLGPIIKSMFMLLASRDYSQLMEQSKLVVMLSTFALVKILH